MTATEEPDEWTKMRRAKWRGRLIAAGVVIVAVGALVGYAALTTETRHFGEPCKKSKDCTDPRGTCLISAKGQTCTTYCDGPKDCAKGYVCELSELASESGASMPGMTKVCVPDE